MGKINRQALLDQLEVLVPITTPLGTSIPVFEDIGIHEDLGQVFNGYIYVESPCKLEVDGLMKGRMLYEGVRRLPGEELTFKPTSTKIQFRSGRCNVTLPTLQFANLLPENGLNRKATWRPVPKGMLQTLELALVAGASVSKVRNPSYEGILWFPDGTVMATDSLLAIVATMKREPSPAKGLISLPKEGIQHVVRICKYLEGAEVTYRMFADQIQFAVEKTCRMVVPIRPLSEEFAASLWTTILQWRKKKTLNLVLDQGFDFKSAMERHLMVYGSDCVATRVTFSPSGVDFDTMSASAGRIQETLTPKGYEHTAEAVVPLKMVKRILPYVTKMMISAESPCDPVIFGGPGYNFVIQEPKGGQP